MGKIIDLTGQKFNNLTVLYPLKERKNRQVVWHCRCDCGKETDVVSQALRTNHTKSCGCLNFASKNAENYTGQVFGNLTVIERYGTSNDRHALWRCKCTCGEERIVKGTDLKNNTISYYCNNCAINNKNHAKHLNMNYEKRETYTKIFGNKFGKIIPLEPTEKRDSEGRVLWRCICDCGNPNPLYLSSNALLTGNTKSCGCLFNHSIGEENIKNILINNNINFNRQVTFENLKSPKNGKLRYDFGLYDNKNNLKFLIEYDGIQHFIPVEYFGGEEEFRYRQICDKIKIDYANSINIPLIKFNYTQTKEEIEEIINDLQL